MRKSSAFFAIATERPFVVDSASSATYGIRPSDWVLRLVAARPMSGGKPWGEGVDVRPAYEALIEALANGSVHESLVADPE